MRISLSKTVARADAALSRYVRRRDSECITCGSQYGLQCGHFIGRAAMSTRFDERNCNAQCAACNSNEHGDFDSYKYRIDEKWGEGTADELVRLSKRIKKWDVYELEKMIEGWKR